MKYRLYIVREFDLNLKWPVNNLWIIILSIESSSLKLFRVCAFEGSICLESSHNHTPRSIFNATQFFELPKIDLVSNQLKKSVIVPSVSAFDSPISYHLICTSPFLTGRMAFTRYRFYVPLVSDLPLLYYSNPSPMDALGPSVKVPPNQNG